MGTAIRQVAPAADIPARSRILIKDGRAMKDARIMRDVRTTRDARAMEGTGFGQGYWPEPWLLPLWA